MFVLKTKSKIPFLYFSFLQAVLACWLVFVFKTDSFYVVEKHWRAVLTMIFGAFIAGSSPEGSAAVAYPVFTLLLKIEPAVARNFAFAIQSIGMTSASILILNLKIKLEWNYIGFVTFGGIFGLIFGTYLVVPFVSTTIAKLFFVSLWLSFGLVLWHENSKPERIVFQRITPFLKQNAYQLLLFGFIGGIISSIFGTGINIFTFCLMTIYFRIDEKIAVPSSVIIMTIETILGFFLHVAVLKDFQEEAFEMWLACVPFVAIFAPLGAFVINKLPRKIIASFLYIILIIQFFLAIWVIQPTIAQLSICFVTLAGGIGSFAFLARLKNK